MGCPKRTGSGSPLGSILRAIWVPFGRLGGRPKPAGGSPRKEMIITSGAFRWSWSKAYISNWNFRTRGNPCIFDIPAGDVKKAVFPLCFAALWPQTCAKTRTGEFRPMPSWLTFRGDHSGWGGVVPKGGGGSGLATVMKSYEVAPEATS